MVKLFITDCEGPISKNDNAYEITQQVISDGDKFFTQISRYDDVQADILKRQGYKAGDTLKLILPFWGKGSRPGIKNERVLIRRFSMHCTPRAERWQSS